MKQYFNSAIVMIISSEEGSCRKLYH